MIQGVAMPSFLGAIEKLKSVLAGARDTDVSSARAVYYALCSVSASIGASSDSELVATSSLNTLEEIFSNRNVILSKALQTVVNAIYVEILAATPGYAVRNVITSLLAIVGHKTLPVLSKECAVLVIGNVMEKRAFDLGSLLNDVIAALTKLAKGSEVVLRAVAVTALKGICNGGGSLLSDCHADILRTGSKMVGDRSTEVRGGVAELVAAVAAHSAGCSSVSADAILSVSVKGLEDENPAVQEKFSYAVACVYFELIQAFVAEQEKMKVGLARGGAAEADKQSCKEPGRRVSLMKLKELSAVKDMLSAGLSKKPSEEFDFQSVVKSLLRQTVRAPHSHLRAAFIVALQYLVEMVIPSLDISDVEWLVSCVLSSLSEQTILTLAYEDIVYYRSRLSHLLRSISSQTTELNQLKLAEFVCSFLVESGASRTEHEIQLAFSELGQLIAALGEASSAAVVSIRAAATPHLRHSSFGVRASAAHALVGLACVVPALASGFFSDALSVAKEQVAVLLKNTTATADDATEDRTAGDGVGTAPPDLAIDVTLSASGGQDSPMSVPVRKSPKDTERLKTMFNFHGQILLISTFLKNEKSISTGLPKSIVLSAFDFGLDMLMLEIFSVAPAMRHVVCSVIRAGSLVISSCLNMGYRMVNSRISKLLSSCSDILFATTNEQLEHTTSDGPGSTNSQTTNSTGGSPDLLYELMSVEAALVCLSALLWFCPEALVFNEHYMELVVDGLDIAFHAIKGKYQSKFKSHFRFRTLHVILLECYSWLPYRSFPSTCQQLFVEGLRTFRDSISSGYECTGISHSMLPEHRILSLSSSRGLGAGDMPLTENQLMLRLEQHAVALQKKESEAFLASFSKENAGFRGGSLYSNDWIEPLSPCAFIDSRTVDAALSLVGATFGSQSDEFQGKAIELCAQILVQVQKSANSVGIFTSDEERRRRDRHALLSTKNTVTLLFNIVESFPPDQTPTGKSVQRNWVNGVSDKLFDLLSYTTNADIRAVAVNALCKLCTKSVGQHLVEAVAIRTIQSIKSCTDKKGEGDGACGYIVALSTLWTVASEKPTLQAAMSTIIFDALKRFDYSPLFRSCTIFALSRIVRSKAIGQGCNDVQDTIALMGRVCDAAEGHLLYGSGNGSTESIGMSMDYDLLLVCLQRLVNATVSIMMEIDPGSLLMRRLFLLWETIRTSSKHPLVERECIEFVVGASMFPTEAFPSLSTALYLQKVIGRRSDVNVETLQTGIAALRALIIRNSKVVCSVGLDVDLFRLLDWAVASAYPLCASPYWGVELRTGLSAVVDCSQALQHSIELALDAIVGIDVQQRPNEAASKWVLLCRAIALGSNGSVQKHDGNDSTQNVATRETDDGGDEKNEPGSLDDSCRMTVQQFAGWKREKGAAKAVTLTSPRCRLRCVALRCSTAAFLGAGRHPAHFDLQLCRAETQAALNALPPNPNEESLESIPCFLSLFLQDLMNMACACAAYTIEDNRQSVLQSEAVDFLHVVVSMFQETVDPDVLTGSGPASDQPPSSKLLELYIAQIVSSLRPCLSARWCPALLLTSGALICDLLRGDLLKDRTVLRRLLKALTGNCAPEQDCVSIRPPMSSEVAEEVAIISHVVNISNLAQVYLLGLESGPSREISHEIKVVILGAVSPLLEKLHDIWEAIAFDGARLMQGHKRWARGTPATDPRRGGMTYGSDCDIVKIRGFYEYALPFVTVALCRSGDLSNPDQMSASFFILESILENLAALPNSQFDHKLFSPANSSGGTVRLSRTCIESLVFSGLACLGSRTVSGEEFNEWTRLLVFLSRDIIPHRVSSVLSSFEYLSLSIEISTTLSSLITVFKSDDNGVQHSEASLKMQQLWHWSWFTALSLLSSFFPDLFIFYDGSASLISASQSYVSSGDIGAVTIWGLLFPAIQRCAQLDVPDIVIDKLRAALKSTVIQDILTVLLDLSKCYWCKETEDFVSRLLIAVLSRLSFYCEADAVIVARKHVVGLFFKFSKLRLKLPDLSRHERLGELALGDLWGWHEYYESNSVLITAKHGNPTHHAKEVVESIFSCWITLFNDDRVVFYEPWPLISFMLKERTKHPDILLLFQKEVLGLIRKSFDYFSPCLFRFMSNAMYSAALLRLSSMQSPAFSELGKELVAFLFLIFRSSHEEESRNILLHLLLTPLCTALSRCSAEDELILVCGGELTEIAKCNADLFKTQVAVLSNENRSVLQNAMRTAIRSTQSIRTGGSLKNNSITGGNAMRIDLSRYKK